MYVLAILVLCISTVPRVCRYVVHEQPDRAWGTEENGVLSGMMGKLQREEYDLCTMASINPTRLAILYHANAYPADGLVLVTRKPAFLSPYLAIVRPFSGTFFDVNKLLCIRFFTLILHGFRSLVTL